MRHQIFTGRVMHSVGVVRGQHAASGLDVELNSMIQLEAGDWSRHSRIA